MFGLKKTIIMVALALGLLTASAQFLNENTDLAARDLGARDLAGRHLQEKEDDSEEKESDEEEGE
jgi:hypothetical protein